MHLEQMANCKKKNIEEGIITKELLSFLQDFLVSIQSSISGHTIPWGTFETRKLNNYCIILYLKNTYEESLSKGKKSQGRKGIQN